MNIRQKTLAALLVLGIGMSGCNTTNTPFTTIKVEKSKEDASQVIVAYAVDNTKPVPTVQDYTDAKITGVNADNLATINAKLSTLATSIAVDNVVDLVQKMVNDVINPVDRNGTDVTATILESIGSQHSKGESNITVAQLKKITPALENINDDYQDSYRSYIASADSNFSSPATRDEVQSMINEVNRLVSASEATLVDIATQHSNGNSDITVAKLKVILPALENINDDYENIYRTYIASADTNIGSPATREEIQSMIDEVNSFNLPTNAILDRSFFKKTNGVFEHRFVYLAVKNNTTGRTWLNNNLGADYANVDSSNYNASQQATASTDYLAYGSMFQWGRKADAHELMDWTSATAGTRKYGETDTTNDNPSDSLFITKYSDWRVNQDDTLWASESSPNNVCPVGYRLPLNPNGAVDAENELAVELNSWGSKDADGSMSSDLKLPTAGGLTSSGAITWWTPGYGIYWTGSVVPSNGNNSTVSDARDVYFGNALGLLDTSGRGIGYSVRCIKDQTPTERSNSILSEIGKEHRSHNSIVTVAQLKAITPALKNINDDYENIYQRYIASADNNLSSPATVDEVQSMIDEVNSFNLPTNAILDRSFFKKTNGVFEHRFVYLAVKNNTTGRTWLNNNLGADYANVDSSNYNASQQATASTDYLAYGSMFQWGRKADAHELMDWTSATAGTRKYGETDTTNDNPSDSLFITKYSDWRVTPDDTLWASESSPNNVCPVGYRLPLNPNGAVDAENELAVELNSWGSKDADGSMSSDLKLPTAGGLTSSGAITWWTPGYGIYWTGSVVPSNGNNSTVSDARDVYFGNALGLLDTSGRGIGYSVRCIKDQTPTERSNSILSEIGKEHRSHNSIVTVAQLKAITPEVRGINNDYEKWYQGYIEATDTHFSSPATREEVQHMIDEVNSFNLPDNAILDKNFYKKTNGKFEHRFVYLPVTNSNTGRTWLNNNLGAWYANVGRNIYNPSQQATNANDNYAKGSLFQWGRKADGHELVTRWWGNGTIDQLATTTTKSDNPTDGKFIAVNSDWRVHPNDDLWKGIDAPNNPCPAHYRVPTKKELDVEAQTWNALTADGSMSSRLKIPGPGWLNSNGYGMFYPGGAPRIWDTTPGVAWRPHETHSLERTNGLPLRCIKDQTPAERSDSILLEIGNEHSSHKSIITIEDLEAILPALDNIEEANEKWYQSYIEGADNSFNIPATIDEVQSMINAVNASRVSIEKQSVVKKNPVIRIHIRSNLWL